MIVLVLGNVAASRRMLALVRDCLATLDSPAAYIDMVEGMRFDPVSAMKRIPSLANVPTRKRL